MLLTQLNELQSTSTLQCPVYFFILQFLSSSDDDCDNEEFDRTKSSLTTRVVGVARRVGYKVKRNEKGETELHTACIQGNMKRVESLIHRVCGSSF